MTWPMDEFTLTLHIDLHHEQQAGEKEFKGNLIHVIYYMHLKI